MRLERSGAKVTLGGWYIKMAQTKKAWVHPCQRNRRVIDSQYTDNKDIPESKKRNKKKRKLRKAVSSWESEGQKWR